ncbi:MAG: oligosaccharide flippase family protein [Candidatus Micrarchaeia archaeon]
MEADEPDSEMLEFGATTAKGGVLFTSSKIISTVVTLVLLIFLARVLRPADYGLYAIAIAFSTTLHASGNFGMATAIRRKLPQLKDRLGVFSVISNAYALSLGITVAVVIAGIALSGFLAAYAYHNSSLTVPLELAALMVLFSVMYNLSVSVLVGIDRVADSAYGVISYSVAQLVAVVALVLLGFGIVGALLGTLLGLATGMIASMLFIIKRLGLMFVKPQKKEMKELGKFTTPLVVSSIASNASMSFAVLVLGLFVSAFVVGEYNAAFKLGSFAQVIIISVAFLLLPAFSKAMSSESLSKKLSSILNGSIYYTLLFLLPLVAYVIAVAKPLIYLFFSSAYSSTPTYFIVIVIGITIGIVGHYGINIIISQGDTKRTTKYQLIVAAAELLLLAALTPLFKVFGVLLSIFIIGPLVMDVIYINALEKSFGISLRYRQLILFSIASIILVVVLLIPGVFVHGKALLLVDAVLAILLYPVIVGKLRIVKSNDLAFIKSVGKRLRLSGITDALVRYTQKFVSE